MSDSEQFSDEPHIAAFVLADTFGETIANNLVVTISLALRGELAPPPGTPVIPGPQFVFETGPRLFCGRRGCGPLRVAWDTNLLIDYFEHGRELWEGCCLPDIVPIYGDELEGLQIIMALWVLRDIRFYLLRATLRDAKGKLSARRLEQRMVAFREFAGALTFVSNEDQPEPPAILLPESALQGALKEVPAGGDRTLVEEAVRRHMHVFLTRDARVLRAREALAPFGLFIGSPLDLFEEVVASGALFCLTDPPGFMPWEAPDRSRVTHLYHATMSEAYRSSSIAWREIEPF